MLSSFCSLHPDSADVEHLFDAGGERGLELGALRGRLRSAVLGRDGRGRGRGQRRNPAHRGAVRMQGLVADRVHTYCKTFMC